VFIEAKFY